MPPVDGEFHLTEKLLGLWKAFLPLQQLFKGFIVMVALVVQNQPANAGDVGLIPGSRRSPGEGNRNPLLPGESYEQRSLADYSP